METDEDVVNLLQRISDKRLKDLLDALLKQPTVNTKLIGIVTAEIIVRNNRSLYAQYEEEEP